MAISEFIVYGLLQPIELTVVQRKPCGDYEWRVVRLGADIGLECLTCGHRVMLERRKLKNRMKKNRKDS